MEPIHRTCSPCETARHPVAAPDMFQLMYHRAIQVLTLPVLCIPWQHDSGLSGTADHWSRHSLVHEHFDPAMNPELDRGRFGGRLATPPRQTRSAQPTDLPQACEHREQKECHPGDPEAD